MMSDIIEQKKVLKLVFTSASATHTGREHLEKSPLGGVESVVSLEDSAL